MKAMRTSISVPVELKARMNAVDEPLNWSALACRAFEEKLAEVVRRKPGDGSTDRPSCASCPYWDHIDEDRGICRRSRPSIAGSVLDEAYPRHTSEWPPTRDIEWCGEHPDFPAYIASFKRGPGGASI